MLGLIIVAFWFALVAAYLVRQWWEGELTIADCGLRIAEPDVHHAAATQTAEWGVRGSGRTGVQAVPVLAQSTIRNPQSTIRYAGSVSR
jgi:hypothetical protein